MNKVDKLSFTFLDNECNIVLEGDCSVVHRELVQPMLHPLQERFLSAGVELSILQAAVILGA